MKKFLQLIALFALISTGAWAEELTISLTTGKYNNPNNGTNIRYWQNTWTSNQTNPLFTFKSYTSGTTNLAGGFNFADIPTNGAAIANLTDEQKQCSYSTGKDYTLTCSNNSYGISQLQFTYVSGTPTTITADGTEGVFTVSGMGTDEVVFTVSEAVKVLNVVVTYGIDYTTLFNANIKPWIDNIGNGYFTLDGNNEDVKALQTAYDNHTSDTWSETEYNTLLDLLTAAKASENAYIMPKTGYYLIKNTRYSQYVGFGTSSDTSKGNGLILYSAICPATVLKLVEKGNNKYTVSSQGLFGKQFPTNVRDQLLPFTNVEGDAKEFTFTPVDGNGNVAISTEPYTNPNPNNNKTIGYWHGTSWDGVVSWEKDAEPSWFTVEDAIGKSFNINMNAVGEKNYATTYLPFPVVLSEAAAYTVKVNGKQAEYTLAGSEIPAGEAVLLISDNSATLQATVKNVTTTVGENALLGVYAKTAAANLENPTVLNAVGDKIGFYRLAATSTLSANRAYLNYAVPAGAKEGFDLVDANETTGVESIDNAQFAIDNAPVYNLQGQRVVKAQKGVFIQNGKKVVVK